MFLFLSMLTKICGMLNTKMCRADFLSVLRSYLSLHARTIWFSKHFKQLIVNVKTFESVVLDCL